MPVKQTHVHKYYLTQLGGERIGRNEKGKKILIKTEGYPIFKCANEGCTHYIQRILASGRRSICWKCNEEMIMKSYNISEKKPHHRECRKSKEN